MRSVHEGKKDFQCDHCGKSFTAVQTLKKHVKSVHEGIIIKHECHMCDKSFVEKTGLKRHIRIIHDKIEEPRSGSINKTPFLDPL